MLTFEEAIERANKVHNNKYDYSEFEYKNMKTKSTIICHNHNEGKPHRFYKSISEHTHKTSRTGCNLCSIRPLVTQESFIKNAEEVHGDRYILDKIKYVNAHTKITIGCRIHGYFDKTACEFIRGRGCSDCYELQYEKKRMIKLNKEKLKKPKLNEESFRKQAKEVHGDKYILDKVKFVNLSTKVIIECRKHGEFQQSPYKHINGSGCPKCSGRGLTRDEIIEKANEVHDNEYNYDDFVYVDSSTPSWITCKEHGKFKQTMSKHIKENKGCSMCHNKTEGILLKLLKENFNCKIIHNRGFDWCKKKGKLRYDFIIEDLKCIIELDGLQHFNQVWNWSPPEEQLENDTFKNEKALENGYSMIRVLQPDIYNNKRDVILKLISSIKYYKEPQLICIGDMYHNRFNPEGKFLINRNHWIASNIKEPEEGWRDYYFNTFNSCTRCELCYVEFVNKQDHSKEKCLDHDHMSGYMRSICCRQCKSGSTDYNMKFVLLELHRYFNR